MLGLRLQVGDEPGGLLRQSCGLPELGGDLGDFLRCVVRSEYRGLRGKVTWWHALGRLVEGDEVLTGLRVGSVEDGRKLLVVRRRKAVEAEVVAGP
jgi:hypothetical protein